MSSGKKLRRGIARRFLLCAVAASFALPLSTERGWAWGGAGHRVIGHIAELHLTEKARAEVDKLLGPEKKLSDNSVANWADHIRGSRPETGPWHYVNIPLDASGYDAERDCKYGKCVVDAIDRFARVLADTSATMAAHAEALRFVVHFVGDLHQPLHSTQRNGDRGGNLCRVTFLTQQEPTNLHTVWDSSILSQALGAQDALDYANALHSTITTEQREKWGAGNTADWAQESREMAVNHAYAGVPAEHGVVHLDEGYVAENKNIVAEQLAKAGVRLAKLLNKALE